MVWVSAVNDTALSNAALGLLVRLTLRDDLGGIGSPPEMEDLYAAGYLHRVRDESTGRDVIELHHQARHDCGNPACHTCAVKREAVTSL
jgi:hypothetical protein